MPASARRLCATGGYRLLAGRLVLPWVLAGLRPAGRVLEIGAGSGAMAQALLRAAPAGRLRIVATDYDPVMVAAAAAALAPYRERAQVQRADAAALPFADASFDAVLSFAMLHHVGGWERALAEALRVLRPGGWLAGYDLLDGPAVRLIHRAGGGEVRLMTAGQLTAALRRLPVARVRVRRSAGGLVARFWVVKAA